MKLYWCPKTRAMRIVWMLEELGEPYERVAINIRDPEDRANPDFRAASPMGKVPALADGETKLWDSGAICLYLTDQYPTANLGVAIGDPQRGRYLQWLMFNNAVIEPSMMEKFAKVEPRPQYGHGSFDRMIETLKSGLEPGPWILGERFTAADVMVGSGIHFLETFGILGDEPMLTDYVARCRDREAFQRAAAFDV